MYTKISTDLRMYPVEDRVYTVYINYTGMTGTVPFILINTDNSANGSINFVIVNGDGRMREGEIDTDDCFIDGEFVMAMVIEILASTQLVNSRRAPEPPTPQTELIRGDTHGNLFNILYPLIHYRVINNITKKNYHDFFELYVRDINHQQISALDIITYKRLLAQMTVTPIAAITFLGDFMADRMGNDLWTILFFDALIGAIEQRLEDGQEAKDKLKLILGNHDAELILCREMDCRYDENIGSFGARRPVFAKSLYNLQRLIDQGVVSLDELEAPFARMSTCFKALDCSINEERTGIILKTHALVGYGYRANLVKKINSKDLPNHKNKAPNYVEQKAMFAADKTAVLAFEKVLIIVDNDTDTVCIGFCRETEDGRIFKRHSIGNPEVKEWLKSYQESSENYAFLVAIIRKIGGSPPLSIFDALTKKLNSLRDFFFPDTYPLIDYRDHTIDDWVSTIKQINEVFAFFIAHKSLNMLTHPTLKKDICLEHEAPYHFMIQNRDPSKILYQNSHFGINITTVHGHHTAPGENLRPRAVCLNSPIGSVSWAGDLLMYTDRIITESPPEPLEAMEALEITTIDPIIRCASTCATSVGSQNSDEEDVAAAPPPITVPMNTDHYLTFFQTIRSGRAAPSSNTNPRTPPF